MILFKLYYGPHHCRLMCCTSFYNFMYNVGRPNCKQANTRHTSSDEKRRTKSWRIFARSYSQLTLHTSPFLWYWIVVANGCPLTWKLKPGKWREEMFRVFSLPPDHLILRLKPSQDPSIPSRSLSTTKLWPIAEKQNGPTSAIGGHWGHWR